MNLTKMLFLMGIILMTCIHLQAQDPVYSQYFNSPILTNAAFAGNNRGALVSIMYRNQWPAIDKAYTTYSVAYDQRLWETSGAGLYVSADDAGNGALKTTKFGAIYSYMIRVEGDTYIKGALDIAYGQTRLDGSRFVFLDNLDPQYGLESPGGVRIPTSEVLNSTTIAQYLDVSSGLLLYNSLYYAGFSVKHMNSPGIEFVSSSSNQRGDLPIRMSFQGGMQIPLLKGNKRQASTFISPNLLITKQGPFWQVNANAFVNRDQLFGGLGYRLSGLTSDAIIAAIGWKSGIFKITYSYDYTVSGLSVGSGGSHEVSVGMNFDKFLPKRSKYNDCLMLFR